MDNIVKDPIGCSTYTCENDESLQHYADNCLKTIKICVNNLKEIWRNDKKIVKIEEYQDKMYNASYNQHSLIQKMKECIEILLK